MAKSLPRAGETSFTRQQEPLGLGHAVWCARDIIGDEPFALLLPDMLIHAKPGCLRQMMDVYDAQGGGNVIAVEEVPWDHVHRYGVVKPGTVTAAFGGGNDPTGYQGLDPFNSTDKLASAGNWFNAASGMVTVTPSAGSDGSNA